MSSSGWSGIRRHSEVRQCKQGHLCDKPLGKVWEIPYSKTDSLGLGKSQFLPRAFGSPICPVELLDEWIQFRCLQLGRELVSDDVIFQNTGAKNWHTPVQDQTFRKQLMHYFGQQLKWDQTSEYTSVSLRGGGAEFYQLNKSADARVVATQQGGWQSQQMIDVVYQPASKEHLQS